MWCILSLMINQYSVRCTLSLKGHGGSRCGSCSAHTCCITPFSKACRVACLHLAAVVCEGLKTCRGSFHTNLQPVANVTFVLAIQQYRTHLRRGTLLHMLLACAPGICISQLRLHMVSIMHGSDTQPRRMFNRCKDAEGKPSFLPVRLTAGSAPFQAKCHCPGPWKGRFMPACPGVPEPIPASADWCASCTITLAY